MVSITKLAGASVLCSLCVLLASGCATTSKTAQAQPAAQTVPTGAPQTPPNTSLSYTREIPDGGLAPVAEAPHGSSWGNNFLPPGN